MHVDEAVDNAGLLATGGAGVVPCTPAGAMMLLKDLLGDLSGLEAVVVGRSNIVGKPMAQLLLKANCTVTVAHSRSRDLPAICRRADILVAAVGRAEMIKGDWIKPGAAVINVGINRIPAPEKGEGKTRLVGDVAFAEAALVAGAITPVPGGRRSHDDRLSSGQRLAHCGMQGEPGWRDTRLGAMMPAGAPLTHDRLQAYSWQ